MQVYSLFTLTQLFTALRLWTVTTEVCQVSQVKLSCWFICLQTLDTRELKIVSVKANGQVSRFTTGPKHSFKGTPLDITLPFDLSR